MLNRRKVLFGAAALMAAALPAMPVMASDSRLLADILAGVSDALTRDYIRRHLSGRPLGRQPLELRRPPLHGRRVRPLLVEALRGAPRAEEAVRAREAAAASAAEARVTGLRLRRTSTDRAVVRLRLCGPRTLRAEGLPEDGPEASAASTRSGPAPAAFRRSRPQAAACRRSGAPSPARRRSASASLRRSGRQRPGRSRRSPLTPLRLNRSRTSHRDAGPSPIHGLPTVSIQVPVFGLTNVRWRTIILAMEG